ncbi:MAG: TolC family protein [Desulfobacterales bacterium]|nr:TolC family protein [Desulfobacterales bacterium]
MLKHFIFHAIALVLAVYTLFAPRPRRSAKAASRQESQNQPNVSVTESSGLFTLDRCIEIALDKNPEIAAAKWDIAAADARYDDARSAFWPQISAEGGYQRYVDDQRLIAARYNGELGVFDNDVLRGDLVARMNLYAGGRITSEAGAAGKLSAAEKKKFIRTRDELIYSSNRCLFFHSRAAEDPRLP